MYYILKKHEWGAHALYINCFEKKKNTHLKDIQCLFVFQSEVGCKQLMYAHKKKGGHANAYVSSNIDFFSKCRPAGNFEILVF